ncbi:hypothetical protein BX600DRAFT_513474 [Xylariales sp. PMI_506]|nr:hypothetical protein BX600DRAFT_513474 [Xylariales sp. PMI_506]
MPDLGLYPIQILPIAYQSKGISFPDWASLYTLCLAPLLAHIIAGTPSPSYLCDKRPKWYNRVVHYNPTSILWRYAIITDRRIRARSWTRIEMAATNALFWTERGWDRSEDMVDVSLPHCIRLPSHPRAAIVSVEMLKTLIVTIQGIQAILLLVQTLWSGYDISESSSFTLWMAVDIVFFPIAFIGLLRISCSLWLNDEALYAVSPINETTDGHTLTEYTTLSTADRFRKTSFWPSRLYRFIYLLPAVSIWIICLVFILTAGALTMTDFLVLLFYFVFLAATIIICAFYFIRDDTTSTVIPCISSPWYRIYTAVITALALALIIVASIETRRTPCGKYTSGVGSQADYMTCASLSPDTIIFTSSDDWFGLARTGASLDSSYNDTVLRAENYMIYNFTGLCLGTLDPDGVNVGPVGTTSKRLKQ